MRGMSGEVEEEVKDWVSRIAAGAVRRLEDQGWTMRLK